MNEIERLQLEIETTKFIYNEIILKIKFDAKNEYAREIHCRLKAYKDTLTGQLKRLLDEKQNP